jgi:hypothetical protein
MREKPQLPPSLSSMRSAPSPDEDGLSRQMRERRNTQIDRENEGRKKLKASEIDVTKAMGSLKLTAHAKSKISTFIPLFEQTYFDVERQKRDHPTPAATVEKQLVDMTHKCVALASYLDVMSRDVIQEWSYAAGFAGTGWAAVWQVSRALDEMAEIAERAFYGFKAAPRSGATRGRPKDTLAKAGGASSPTVCARKSAPRN